MPTIVSHGLAHSFTRLMKKKLCKKLNREIPVLQRFQHIDLSLQLKIELNLI